MEILRWSFVGVFRCITLTLFLPWISYLKNVWPQTLYSGIFRWRGIQEFPSPWKSLWLWLPKWLQQTRTSKPFKIVQLKNINKGCNWPRIFKYSTTFLWRCLHLSALSNASKGNQWWSAWSLPSNFSSRLLELGFDCTSIEERFTFSDTSAKFLPQCLSPLDAIIIITTTTTIPSVHGVQRGSWEPDCQQLCSLTSNYQQRRGCRKASCSRGRGKSSWEKTRVLYKVELLCSPVLNEDAVTKHF